MTTEEGVPKRICIIGYNTLLEAKGKGLISDDPSSMDVWYNPGGGFDLSVVFIPFGKQNLDVFLTPRIRYVEWPFPKGLTGLKRIGTALTQLLRAVWIVARIIRSEDLQVLRANGPHIPALISFLLRGLVRIPTIVFIEAFWEKLLPSQEYIPTWLRCVLPYWYKLIVYRFFEIYCGTPSVDPDYFIELGMDRGKISDWFHELDLEALIRKAEASPLPSSVAAQSGPRLVAVGRLHQEKHPDDLVQVLVHVKKYFPLASLILVGDGGERERLTSQAAALGAAGSLCITGALAQAQGLAVVNACDIYVAPMQGNALVEAMAAGKPIVAYDHAWHQNLVSHDRTALLTPYRDVDKMAEMIIFLLQTPKEAERLGKAARLHALQYFGRDAVANRLRKPFIDAWNTIQK